jgi:hypothetical protein
MAVTLSRGLPDTVALATTLTEVLLPNASDEILIVPASGATVHLFGTGVDGAAAGADYIPIPSGGIVLPASGSRILLAASSGTPNVHLLVI